MQYFCSQLETLNHKVICIPISQQGTDGDLQKANLQVSTFRRWQQFQKALRHHNTSLWTLFLFLFFFHAIFLQLSIATLPAAILHDPAVLRACQIEPDLNHGCHKHETPFQEGSAFIAAVHKSRSTGHALWSLPRAPAAAPVPVCSRRTSGPTPRAGRAVPRHTRPHCCEAGGEENDFLLIAKRPQNTALPTAAARDFLSKHLLAPWVLCRSSSSRFCSAEGAGGRAERAPPAPTLAAPARHRSLHGAPCEAALGTDLPGGDGGGSSMAAAAAQTSAAASLMHAPGPAWRRAPVRGAGAQRGAGAARGGERVPTRLQERGRAEPPARPPSWEQPPRAAAPVASLRRARRDRPRQRRTLRRGRAGGGSRCGFPPLGCGVGTGCGTAVLPSGTVEITSPHFPARGRVYAEAGRWWERGGRCRPLPAPAAELSGAARGRSLRVPRSLPLLVPAPPADRERRKM